MGKKRDFSLSMRKMIINGLSSRKSGWLIKGGYKIVTDKEGAKRFEIRGYLQSPRNFSRKDPKKYNITV